MSDLASPEWELAHRELVRLSVAQAAHEHTLGKALLRALRVEVWRPMGFATFIEYAERVVGLRPRQTEERLRVAQALEKLPRMSETLAQGLRPFSAVRELTRVATPETEGDWLAATDVLSVGEIAKMVAGRRPGDRPDDPPCEVARRHIIVLDVSAETYALYREAQAKIRRDTDERLSEGDGLLVMARTILGGPADTGRSSYQVRVTQCETCCRATVDGRGQAVTVDPTVAELAACDAQRVDDTGKATQEIPPATRRLVVRRHHGKCAVPGCRNTKFIDLHHLRSRSEGGSHDPANLTALCGAHHTAVHRGALVIEGTGSTDLLFRHADGSSYGASFKGSDSVEIVTTVRPHVRAEGTVTEELWSGLRTAHEASVLAS